MNRGLALSIGLGALLATRLAFAQDVTIGYQGLPYKASGESNTGIQVSDGLLLHVGVGAEAGYDTNVFYDATAPLGSWIFRVLPYAELTNATRTGAASKLVTFDLRAGLQYRHYQSDDARLQPYKDARNPNAGGSLSVGGAQLGLGVADVYSRIEDPPYASGGQILNPGIIERNNNQASIEGRWSPGGGRLTATLRYTNMLDIYYGHYNYADADTNQLMLDVAWKWLPKTAVFLNVQQGYVDYFNASASANEKVASYPLYVTTGLRGLLTDKTSAVLQLGYVNGFYSKGGSTGGFLGSTYASLTLTATLTQLSRLVIGARHDFLNAVVGNFSYEETAYASFVQQIAGRLGLDVSGRYAYLSYEGEIADPNQRGRHDNFFQVGASLDYFLRDWAYLGVGYSLLDNRSNIAIDQYVKQQIFARLGLTY